MPKRVKILAKLWLIYFVMSIGFIGIFFSALFYFPVLALAKVFPRLERVRERFFTQGVRFLMWIQPWYKAEVALDVPHENGGVLIVSNHRSHLDVFMLLSRVPGIRIMAKSTLFRIPFLSIYMRTSQQIRVERNNLNDWVRAMDEVGRRLSLGEKVHVFPELTRCEPGFKGLRPFAAGPFQAAIKQDALVLPVVFQNTDGVWPKGDPGLSFREPVSVRSLEPVRARDFSNAFLLRDEVTKRMKQALTI
jgi:1-acyl-sn-glycerol-3-phosphate acyltransferase